MLLDVALKILANNLKLRLVEEPDVRRQVSGLADGLKWYRSTIDVKSATKIFIRNLNIFMANFVTKVLKCLIAHKLIGKEHWVEYTSIN